MKMPNVLTSYFPLVGGLNDVSPPLVVPPGRASSAINFEVDVDGGYRRIDGYSCYDGSDTPAAIPGSGDVLGVWLLNGIVYAFRNHTDGLSAKMWKSNAAGWTEVTTGVSLVPGGDYRFITYNFGGLSGTMMMYGCDGKNKAFQFDGTTFTQLTTGMTTDTPHLIAAHKNHLFLAFDASVQLSSIGDPTTWSPITGAGEIALGEKVTGMVSQSGDASGSAMVIATRNSLQVLYGTSGDWNLVLMQQASGAIEATAQSVTGKLMALDDRGVVELTRSMAFGNFDSATVTREVTSFLNEHRPRTVAASVSRDRNQYRLHFSDGYSLYVTVFNGEVVGSMPVYFPDPVTCICSVENETGSEDIYFGSTNGKVYKMGGTSFDGTSISSHVYLSFTHFKSPRDRKRFRRLIIDLRGTSDASLDIGYVFDYGGTHVAEGVGETSSVATNPAFWDNMVWDSFIWDGISGEPIRVDLAGTGYNISVRIVNDSASTDAFTVSGVTFHFTPRRQER